MAGYDCLNCDLARLPAERAGVRHGQRARRHAADRRRAGARAGGGDRARHAGRAGRDQLQADVRGRAAARPRRRAVRAGCGHDHAGADRVDRHGQVDRRGDVRRRRDPGVRRRRGGARAAGPRRAAGRSRSRRASPARRATARSIARRLPRRCSAIRASSPRSRRSSTPRSTTSARASSSSMAMRRALLFDIPLLFETGGEAAFDKVIVVSGAGRGAARARAGAAGDDRGEARLDPRAAIARRRQARPRRLRHRHVGHADRDPRPGESYPCLSWPRDGCLRRPCAKSSSTPKPRA